MPRFELISFNLCPFVQRSVIALEEKGLDYDIKYIDLSNKPDWFLKISPTGRVPLLKVTPEGSTQPTVLFESMVICEYLDEVTDNPLHPSDPLEKAQHRAMIDFGGGLGGPGYVMMVTPDESRAKEAAAKARKVLETFEEKLGEGPFYAGERFSLLDAATTPFLQRLKWAAEIEPELDVFKGLPRVSAWAEALLSRPSVQRSTLSNIRELYLEAVTAPRDQPAWLSTRIQRSSSSSS